MEISPRGPWALVKLLFYLILVAVLTFSAGVNMRPTDGDTTIGVLGNPGMAERVFAAIERGSEVNIALSDKWDYWPYVPLPIDEVRWRLNILPAWSFAGSAPLIGANVDGNAGMSSS